MDYSSVRIISKVLIVPLCVADRQTVVPNSRNHIKKLDVRHTGGLFYFKFWEPVLASQAMGSVVGCGFCCCFLFLFLVLILVFS